MTAKEYPHIDQYSPAVILHNWHFAHSARSVFGQRQSDEMKRECERELARRGLAIAFDTDRHCFFIAKSA